MSTVRNQPAEIAGGRAVFTVLPAAAHPEQSSSAIDQGGHSAQYPAGHELVSDACSMDVASSCFRCWITSRTCAWRSLWINSCVQTMWPNRCCGESLKRGRSDAIVVGNGSEFAGKVMYRRADEGAKGLDSSRRGAPIDNAVVGGLNGRLRQECVNERWFLSLADARSKTEAWQRFHSGERTYSALPWKAPAEFVQEHGTKRFPSRRKRARFLPADDLVIGGR